MIKIFSILLLFITSTSLAEVVNKIDINGNERISKNTILMFSDVSVGDDIEINDTNKILLNLYETRFFKNVEVSFVKNNLKINVVEFPIVQNVLIEGIKSNKIVEKISDNIFFKERSSFNDIYLTDDKDKVKSILVFSG